METKSKILSQIKDKFEKTHGGITIIELLEINETTYSEMKKVLNELYKEKKIITRQSINQILIYIKQ
jgi:C-terminal processing protease CtpA/Prc